MASHLPETSARRAPENLAILLREPFRIGSDTDAVHARKLDRDAVYVRTVARHFRA